MKFERNSFFFFEGIIVDAAAKVTRAQKFCCWGERHGLVGLRNGARPKGRCNRFRIGLGLAGGAIAQWATKIMEKTKYQDHQDVLSHSKKKKQDVLSLSLSLKKKKGKGLENRKKRSK